MLAPVSCGMLRAEPLHCGRQVVAVPVGVIRCDMINSDKHAESRLCLYGRVWRKYPFQVIRSSAVHSNVWPCCVM